ncbi:bifunctional 5,10-methylenetetrahydrofolate dehydrogenase/5,10-methenyltetrahydrofolate cyclohydrolase [Anaerococcus tetradius]|uniref:methenyltetrahydrofolate cyclohydrolase n=1 Tax=Anaerococcus tetradius TaxID=33036 RepID=A0A133KHG2_9FIRM|nr:bifunctional 5,10-methylenetetrahydrofolate dehydrogenase/5,10-methenyltetrahydrofolate cyclohydrolase [Anaerococcus tetradius]KWZ78968.1 tetrahydrofolate dehydrogenase/cyclohydrolase, NAD(P)-binding domain protein [Anaerococcus tetradius]
MKQLTTDRIKDKLVKKLSEAKIKRKILLLSQNPTAEVNFYKNIIIKRCRDFGIVYVDKEFEKEDSSEILAYLKQYDREDAYIFLAPFAGGKDLSELKKKVELTDLDAFTYKSLGMTMQGDISSLPATARAVASFLEERYTSFRGKNIVIANTTMVIGKPLAMYLSSKSATVSLINSKTKNPKEMIKNSDIFISAIGKANFYDKSYFRDQMLIVDVGTSYIDGKVYGDVAYESIADMDVEILTNKKGIGAITTLKLLEGLI